ncbi:MAG TPA: hypothetical protein VMY78_06620 [Solirubrobacteraceae bacterium]|nr:hypothetical protein [Solirubrobacteraceae bacterium]
MGSLEDLNDGQRAVLQLLLGKGKSYDEIAALLHSDASAVRRRAQGAVHALGPESPAVSEERRSEIADYLLGQQTASQRAATREVLEDSAESRSWARSTAMSLAPFAADGALPDIPAEREEVAEAFGALEARTARQEEVQRSSQLGGKLIAAGLGLVLALVIILVVSLSGGDSEDTPSASATTPTGTSTAAASVGGNPQILAQGTLRPPEGNDSPSTGEVAIVRFPETNRFRLALTAQKLPPGSASGSAYGVWLYSSPENALFLGFPDKVVAKDGNLDTVAELSPDTPNYREVLLTRERTDAPKRPGTIILRARLAIAQTAPQGTGTQTAPPAQTQTTP